MSVVTIAPTVNELEDVLIDEFRSYLHHDFVELVFCYTSSEEFIDLAEGLAAFLNVPVEEAANYLLPICKSTVSAIAEYPRICAHNQLPVIEVAP